LPSSRDESIELAPPFQRPIPPVGLSGPSDRAQALESSSADCSIGIPSRSRPASLSYPYRTSRASDERTRSSPSSALRRRRGYNSAPYSFVPPRIPNSASFSLGKR